ncbi:hypothetical protein G6F22_017159 [Rhizopus arrhizus]|nr:hypothetical protein G6F22_017159 [Rhizopus arrhizus]
MASRILRHRNKTIRIRMAPRHPLESGSHPRTGCCCRTGCSPSKSEPASGRHYKDPVPDENPRRVQARGGLQRPHSGQAGRFRRGHRRRQAVPQSLR